MPSNSIGPRIGVEGESKFRKQIQDINAQLRTLDAEAKNLSATFEGQEDSVEALTAKQKNLTRQIELQQKAVNELQDFWERNQEKLADDEQATQRWEQAVIKANTQLTKLQNELERTNDALDQSNSKINKIAQGTETAASRLNSAGNALSVGLTAPLIAAGTATVNYASDTEEAMNKVDVAFGDAAASVVAWSEDTLTSIGLAQRTALDMAALYGDMATSMGYSQKEAAEMSKTLVELAGDLASFKNLGIDEVNTALKSVFTGETESLKELGVVMTEANLEAYALEKGLSKTYAQMSQNEKVSLRYQYVLDMTANAQGDFARTSDSTANQLRILRESLKQAAASLGSELLPVVTPVIQRLGELVQSFSSLDDGTKKAIVQVGLFLAALGPALKITGGLTSAINAGISAYQALRTATTAATTAQTALNAAQSASPIGAIVTAVGAVVAVLGSFALSSALAKDKAEDLANSVERVKNEYAEAADEINEEKDTTLGMISALEDLTEVENKSAAQKQQMLDLVDRLNEAVPGLSLAYDEQTDAINMTADAVRELAEAEAYRQLMSENMDALTEQYRIQAEAEEKLLELRQKEAEIEEQFSGTLGFAQAVGEVREEIRATEAAYESAQAAIDDLTAEYEEMAERVADVTSTTEDATAAAEDQTSVIQDQTEALEDEADAAEESRKATDALSKSADTLTSALEEQTSSGSLSLQTALDLIDAGYAAALAFDSESGAIEINERAYIALAKAKIEEQLASKETERAHLAAEQASLKDAYAAMENAGAYYQVAEAKAAANDEIKKYDVEIAALKQAKKELENYSFQVNDTSDNTVKSSQKVVTQAEKDLEKYKDIRAEYDHLLAMGEITEEEYYKKLAEIRDTYLTDKDNIEEYRKINEEIYKYDKDLAAKEDELWAEQTESIVSELQNRLDEVVSARDEMASKLADYGDLFTQGGELIFTVNDLSAQIAVLDEYERVLTELQRLGISDSLLGEITGMNVEDAILYGQQLLAMTDEQWEEYNQLWEEKQQRAIEIATQFYQDQLDTLQTEYDEKLGTALDSLVTTAYDSGVDTAQGLADGISDNSAAAIEAATLLAQQIAAAMDTALDINSPSGVTEKTGRYTAQGFEVGYVDEMRDIRDRMARGTSLEDTANTAAAGIVNGIASLPQTGGTYQINIKVGSAELASVLFDPLRGVIKQRGESLG